MASCLHFLLPNSTGEKKGFSLRILKFFFPGNRMQHKTVERRKNRKMVSPFFSWKSGCDGDGALRGLIMRDTEDAAAAVEKNVSREKSRHRISQPKKRRKKKPQQGQTKV